MASRLLTQKQLAEFLDLSPKWVRSLEKKGVLPTRTLGAKKFYPWPEALRAYIAYREELKEGKTASDLEEARARKVQAEADLAELKAAELRRTLLPTRTHFDLVGRLLDYLRAQILSVPGHWGPQLVAMGDVREAVGRIRPLTHQLLEDLNQMVNGWIDETYSTSGEPTSTPQKEQPTG